MKRNKKTKLTLGLIILMALISLTLVMAAEQPAPSSKSPNITFTPTEEISEDLPVAFPADI